MFFEKSKKGIALSTLPLHLVKNVHQTLVSDRTTIRFSHVYKSYRLYNNDRGRFLNSFFRKKNNPYLLGVKLAGHDLTFEIHQGEAVAILGRNGMGKSTTLKMIAGLCFPDSGKIEVNGRVSALLELAAGFDNELTGRENIVMRGLIMGLNEKEISILEDDIVTFSELDLYFDQPMRTYSSGMKARLGFAFAVAIEPEILIVDETLSVGDKTFQKKCIARVREIMMNENVTLLLVTHATKTAQELCSRGIVLNHGMKVFDGPIYEAVDYYEQNY